MLFPFTETRAIELRAATEQDAPKIYDILLNSGAPALPMLDRFWGSYSSRLSAGFIAERTDTGETIGVAELGTLTPAGHLTCQLTTVQEVAPELRTDVVALAVNFAFAMWRTRKVYFQMVDQDPDSIGFGPSHRTMIEPEAILPQYIFREGRLWDAHVFSISRESWETVGADLLKQLV